MQRPPVHTAAPPPIGPVAVRLRLIGQMEAWTLTSESILPTGRKTRALLAIIALSAPRPVLRGKLAEMLWSRRPEEQARASLRQEIHRLLDALDPLGNQVLSITRDHLSLRPGTVWVDVEELLRANPARPAALGLYDGELLEGLDGIDPAFDSWLASERERLSDRARSLAELLMREQTEPETMIASAQQLLRIDRAHEGAWRSLMRAYVARGERGMAIQAYERCRLVLADQLDAQPSSETQRLLNDIRNAVPPKPATVLEAAHAGGGNGAGLGSANSGGSGTGGSGRPSPPRPPMRLPPRTPMHSFEGASEPMVGLLPRSELRVAGRAEAPGPEHREAASREPTARDAARSPAPRGGARVGVMPLQLIGTSEAEAHLSVGLADEITAGLAKFRWMFLVSSSTLARFAGQTRDEAGLRGEFGLDFLLDGVVQRGGRRLRVSLRLLDLRGGNQVVWSRRFERDADDLLDLQDEVSAEAAAQIDQEILSVESQRISSAQFGPQSGPQSDAQSDAGAGEPTAYDLLLRGLHLTRRLERPLFLQAGALMRRAIELEPDVAAPHAWLAWWQIILVAQGWTDDTQTGMAEAVRLAERAIALDPQDARALTIAGHVRAFVHHRPLEAISLHERALAINPSLAMAWNLSGLAFAYHGNLDEAERRIERYRQLAPLDPQAAFFDASRVIVALLRRDHAAAVTIGREVTGMGAAFGPALKPYLAALGHLGMEADVRQARATLLSLEPDFSITRYLERSPLARAEDRAHFADGLRLAGVPA